MHTRLALAIAAMIVASSAFAQPKEEWIADPKTGCKVWDQSPLPKETITWSGACRDGLATGRGVVQWYLDGKPGERDEVEMANGKMNGHGVIRYRLGDIYAGDLQNGQQNGHGVYTYANGNRYDGEWRDDKPNGHGTYTSAGKTYAGNWTNGCFKQGEYWAVIGTTAQACGFK